MSTSISATEIGLPDNAKIKLGTGNDLQIVHNSINTQFTNTTGNLEFITTNTAQFLSSGNVLAKFIPSGACELYHSGTKKFETTSDGVKLASLLDIKPSTYTNIEDNSAYGLNIKHMNEKPINIATGGDYIQIYDLTSSKLYIRCEHDAGVKLYNNNSTKLETTSGGVSVTGTVTSSSHIISGGMVDISDNNQLRLGDDQDMMISHDGTSGAIRNATGELYLRSDGIRLVNNGNSETFLTAANNGAIELYHNNTNRFETTSDGALVSGRLSIGAAAANNKINVLGAAGNGQTTLYYGFGTIDLTSASDERVKNNVVPTAKGLDDILKLPIVDFTYKSEYAADYTTVRTGGIAQEWQKVDPNLVNAENEDLLFIEYKRVIPHLIKALQEAVVRIEALEAA